MVLLLLLQAEYYQIITCYSKLDFRFGISKIEAYNVQYGIQEANKFQILLDSVLNEITGILSNFQVTDILSQSRNVMVIFWFTLLRTEYIIYKSGILLSETVRKRTREPRFCVRFLN